MTQKQAPGGDAITLRELKEKLADPTVDRETLKRYFREDMSRSGAFAPSVEVNPETVSLPEGLSGPGNSEAMLDFANWLWKANRQTRYYERIIEGYGGPKIVEEGDSWHQYPFRLHDVIDVLMEKYAILSLSGGGHELGDMVDEKEYLSALRDTGATILLLSAGGNDLVADGNLVAYLNRPASPATRARDLLKGSFDRMLRTALAHYRTIFREVATRFPGVQIVCHGYDYTIPANGKWLGKPMQEAGITDAATQRAVARIMVDRFNKEMAALADAHAHVHYVDLRGTVPADGWHDELHPRNAGYRAVADKIAVKIEQIAGGPETAGDVPLTRSGESSKGHG